MFFRRIPFRRVRQSLLSSLAVWALIGLPLQSGHGQATPKLPEPSAILDCAGQTNGTATLDSCGVCGGSGPGECGCDLSVRKDSCGVCGGTGPGECGCDRSITKDACGVCGGNGPGECGCDRTIVKDSCGVCGGNGPGECGCNLSVTKDACGVCGGDGSSCAPPTCAYTVYQATINAPAACPPKLDCNGKPLYAPLKYDLDHDGIVTGYWSKDYSRYGDYMLIYLHVYNKRPYRAEYDLNGDGVVDQKDVDLIGNLLASPEKALNAPVDLGCGCGDPRVDLGCGCGDPRVKDDCGVCGGNNTSKDACGVCFGPGPTGCDMACGSTSVLDKCGLCGGDGNLCSQPDPNCNLYYVSTEQLSQYDYRFQNYGPVVAIGTGASLDCVKKIVGKCKLTRASTIAKLISNGYCDDEIYFWFNHNIMSLPERWGAIRTSAYMNKNCEPVAAPANAGDACGTLDIRVLGSPISLQWAESDAARTEATLTQFPLAPDSELKWYVWKASAERPLLVYDPQKTGRITTAAQLFGDWSFGGKGRSAAHTGKEQPRMHPQPWRDGYEALASLDADRDGKVAGSELKDLALWFDANQDGVSQPGEVKPLTESGVTALYVTPDFQDPVTRDITARHGYERVIGERTIVGPTVDWYGEGFRSKMEAQLKLQSRGLRLRPDAPAAADTKKTGASSALQDTQALVGGVWEWTLDPEIGISGPPEYRPKGVLSFKEYPAPVGASARPLSGRALVQTDLAEPKGEAAKLVTMVPLTGKLYVEHGRTLVEFTLLTSDGSTAKSYAELDHAGEALKGRTDSFFPARSADQQGLTFNYTWSARRIR